MFGLDEIQHWQLDTPCIHNHRQFF